MQDGYVEIDAAGEDWHEIVLTEEVVERYGLDAWAQDFSLMTAGYRDRLDPEDPDNPDVPFTQLAVAILAEAKARVFARRLSKGEVGSVHIGGEVRPHTQRFIKVAARVYAAHDFRVHLRKDLATTPIWYSSFGVFYEELQSGENFTASHSQYFKGGWKPLDAEGKQVLAEEPEIVAEVREIIAARAAIRLVPWSSELISHNFDVDDAYVAYLRSVVGESAIQELQQAGNQGFHCKICTLGGSMKATTERLFASLDVPTGETGTIDYLLGEEDSEFHRMGHTQDDILGVDPGSPRIYRNVGAQQLLRSGACNLFLIWDPDGDRLNVITVAPQTAATAAREAGLKVEHEAGQDHCIVFFTSNQLYLMLVAFRIETLRNAGVLDRYDWFVGESYPTSKSIEELARREGLPTVRVPVGFKYIGDLCQRIEEQLDHSEVKVEMVTGETVSLGARPRALILCEESGGATLGSLELLRSRHGRRQILALREKDGMQIGMMTIALCSTLFGRGGSLAEYYCDLISRYEIAYTRFWRSDVKLYDEGLMGSELKRAKAEGLADRDRRMAFFRKLAEDHTAGRASLGDIQRTINDRRRDGTDPVPALRRVCSTGEGFLFEIEDAWFMIRASGTDAVMRYYLEGKREDVVTALEATLTALAID